jgi:SNF2 family DNA or RNA helicase
LTGSPAANGLLDLFGQVYIIDLGYALGAYITHYRMEFFTPTGFEGYQWRINDGAEEQIYKRLKPYVHRLSASDHLDMPELVEHEIYVDLPPAAREAYDKMEKELFYELDNGEEFTALSAAAATNKCRQIANGGLYRQLDVTTVTESSKWHHFHDAKTEALRELVDELAGNSILVAYEFDHDRQRLLKEFGKRTPYIGGGVSAKRSNEILRDWNAGRVPVLLGHPAAMAHGVNAQDGGHHIALYGSTWDYELHDQFIRRLMRQGQKSRRVFVYRIIARDTIDVAVMMAMRNKARVQNRLLDALNTYRKGRTLDGKFKELASKKGRRL